LFRYGRFGGHIGSPPLWSAFCTGTGEICVKCVAEGGRGGMSNFPEPDGGTTRYRAACLARAFLLGLAGSSAWCGRTHSATATETLITDSRWLGRFRSPAS